MRVSYDCVSLHGCRMVALPIILDLCLLDSCFMHPHPATIFTVVKDAVDRFSEEKEIVEWGNEVLNLMEDHHEDMDVDNDDYYTDDDDDY